MKPLVSILIPAYNAEKLIAYTLQSAISQTWQRKEIIVVNDGSSDATAEVAKRFCSKEVTLVSTENQGLSAAVNHAFRHCQGDYIQELDADDLLAPDKIERQLAAKREDDSKRLLLSSPWGYFYFRTRRARFVPSSLWQNLSPVEWLLGKMGEGAHMQNATWLVSRELAEAAGPWDTRLQYDQDGEYFSRVLAQSEGTRFVPDAKVFYRASNSNRISYIGNSDTKKDSLFLSLILHIQYIRALEESERVRKACLAYLRIWYPFFYPDRPDVTERLQGLATELGGHLEVPQLRRKFSWMSPVFGRKAATWAQRVLPETKASFSRTWDQAMFKLETHAVDAGPASNDGGAKEN